MLTSANTGTPNTYQYDHDGWRTQETANGTVTKFIWDQLSAFGDVVLEQNNTNVTSASYVYASGRLLSQTKSATLSYLLPDVQGSTRLLINNANSVLQNFDYRAFGEMINAPATPLTRYLYTAQQFDNPTKLYSLRARMYDPSVARFLSMDDYPYNFQNPIELNRYVYAAGNGLRWSDPSGMAAFYEKSSIDSVIKSTYQFARKKLGESFIDGFAAGVIGYGFGLGAYAAYSDWIENGSFSLPRIWNKVGELFGGRWHEAILSGIVGGIIGAANYRVGQIESSLYWLHSARTVSNLSSTIFLTGQWFSWIGGIVSTSGGIISNMISQFQYDAKFFSPPYIFAYFGISAVANVPSIVSTFTGLDRRLAIGLTTALNTFANFALYYIPAN